MTESQLKKVLLTIKSGDLEAVKKGFTELINIKPETLNKLLINAIFTDKLEIVSYLLDQGANPSFSEKNKLPPIFYAAMGKSEILELLIKKGASVNIVIKLISVTKSTPLLMACEKSKFTNVEILLANGADPTVTNHLAQTPLMLAVQKNLLKTVEILLKSDSSTLNATDYNGTSALQYAVEGGNMDLVKLLIKSGADIHYQRASDNSTVLHLSALEGHRELYDYLLELGVDKHIKNIDGQIAEEYLAK